MISEWLNKQYGTILGSLPKATVSPLKDKKNSVQLTFTRMRHCGAVPRGTALKLNATYPVQKT